jgi:hypothetical protein
MVVAVLALLLGLFGDRLRRAVKQRNIVAQIQGAGGIVLYDHQYGFTVENHGDPLWEPPPAAPILLRLILGEDFFADVVYIQFDPTQINDADLARLQGLTDLHGLQHLNLADTHVSDHGLEYLTGLTQLRVLELTGTRVTDEGAEKLQQALAKCKIVR